jgi:hypothetical protein
VRPAPTGLTRTGYGLVVVITALSLSHHVDHAVREVTGWPFDGGFNPFSASLFVYPVIVAGLVLSHRHRVGARSWAVLAGVGAVFVLVVHVGPWAPDSVINIPDQYDLTAAEVIALVLLALFLAALVAHCAHELRRLATARPYPD